MTDWVLLIVSSLLVSVMTILVRSGGRRGATTWGLSLFIALASFAVAVPCAWRSVSLFSWWYGGLMVLGGVLGIAGMWALAEAVFRGPVGPTFTIRSFSIAVPVGASVLFFGEPLGPARLVGLVIVAVAIPLLHGGPKRSAVVQADAGDGLGAAAVAAGGDAPAGHHVSARWLAYALLSLAFYGVADTIFRDACQPGATAELLWGVVLLGFAGNVIGASAGLALSRQRPTRADVIWGSPAGLMSFVAFLLSLFVLRDMGGVLVFTARSVVSIAGVVLLALVLFRERPTLRAGIGLALGAAGLALLAVK